MREREDEPTVEYEVKVLRSSEKAHLCEFEDGEEKWVPKSQTVSFDGNDPDEIEEGTEGTISVTQWIVDQWEMEGPTQRDVVQVPDCTVLRATEKGIQVRAPSIPTPDNRLWLPRKGVHKKSKVQEDGDSGTLLLHQWCAESKGLVEKPASAQEDLFTGPPQPDDDIPF